MRSNSCGRNRHANPPDPSLCELPQGAPPLNMAREDFLCARMLLPVIHFFLLTGEAGSVSLYTK
jgi:hypothetical protein